MNRNAFLINAILENGFCWNIECLPITQIAFIYFARNMKIKQNTFFLDWGLVHTNLSWYHLSRNYDGRKFGKEAIDKLTNCQGVTAFLFAKGGPKQGHP